MEDLRKMNSNVAHDELLSVLNKIRKEQFPEIPESLLKEIVEAEANNQDDLVEARKATRKVLDRFLKETEEDTEED